VLKNEHRRFGAFKDWAIERGDIYNGGFLPLNALSAPQPMRPDKVIERLNLSADELLALLKFGRLARPGRLGDDAVAWRADEIEALVPLKERRF
jgi:predicted DNA-binding transcriptional regulator AlpA